jgi:hypothetical protein
MQQRVVTREFAVRHQPLCLIDGRQLSTSLRFDLNRSTTIRLVLLTGFHGHWRQAAITSVHGYRGDNRRRIAGRWHGRAVGRCRG